MRKKEKIFCVYVAQGKSLEEASRLCGYDESKGISLITKSEIMNEINLLLKAKANLMKNLSVLGYQQLAFGSVADCISLVTESKVDKADLDSMNLFMISEIKKPKEGAMEIKFFDRLKALDKLQNYLDGESQCVPFYEALEKGAKALGDNNE